MKLRFSPASPCVRNVMVSALENVPAETLQRIPTNPFAPVTDLIGDNPALACCHGIIAARASFRQTQPRDPV
ncbi:MAG: hypothetical protein OEN20_00265 [Gammaproteobacteria bacterium]|nr:hypothetical protein [Gammaproteobacteria bacterium]